MTAPIGTDPRCGSPAGYQAHVKARTARCRACLDAQAQWARRYRARRYWARGQVTVDATGTRRRLRALARLGWSYENVADEVGVLRSAVQQWTANNRVYPATAKAVTDLYARWSDQPGPSRKAARRAELAGWPPPIAWDDDTIDDPTTEPFAASDEPIVDEVAIRRAMHGDQVTLTRAERLEAVRLLTDAGHSSADIAARLGQDKRAVVRDRATTREVAS